jgi:hypothetical protein
MRLLGDRPMTSTERNRLKRERDAKRLAYLEAEVSRLKAENARLIKRLIQPKDAAE